MLGPLLVNGEIWGVNSFKDVAHGYTAKTACKEPLSNFTAYYEPACARVTGLLKHNRKMITNMCDKCVCKL